MTPTHTSDPPDPNLTVRSASGWTPDGRTPDGRFAPGNRFRRETARPARMRELRQALAEAATPEDLREVLRSLRDLAIGGDVRAAKVYLDHVAGKPPTAGRPLRVAPPEPVADPAE